MKKYQPVKCRICGQLIDRNIEQENVDWIMPSTKYFYHKSCYENWKQGTPENDDAYISFIYDYISRDLKVKYDYYMCEAQRQKFIKDKMTNKGIFFYIALTVTMFVLKNSILKMKLKMKLIEL